MLGEVVIEQLGKRAPLAWKRAREEEEEGMEKG